MNSLEEFEIEDVIGAGTVGTIYRARNRTTGEIVALKMLKGDAVKDPNIEQRFVREVAVLKKLDHENIVKYHECGLGKQGFFFTMEFIDSGSLKQLLHGSVPWQDAVDLGLQVSAAIEHAHQLGVVHRDLKPANLFLSGDGFVKVGDFGIALDIDKNRLTADGLTVGTCRYMAPEQITADVITPQADIYSLGCILYEMLAGRVPFEGENDIQIIEQHLTAPPPNVEDANPLVPPKLSQLIQRMLSKKPDQRPASAEEVRRELVEIRANPQGDTTTQSDSAARAEAAPRVAGDERPAASAPEPADPTAAAEPNLTERLQQQAPPAAHQASWSTIAVILTIVVGVVLAAWAFSPQS